MKDADVMAEAEFEDLGEHPRGPLATVELMADRVPGRARCPKCRRSRKPHVSWHPWSQARCMRCNVRWRVSILVECMVCGTPQSNARVCDRCDLLFGQRPVRKLGSMRRQLRTTLRAFDEAGIPEEERMKVLRARRALAGPTGQKWERVEIRGSFTFIPETSVEIKAAACGDGNALLRIELK